MEPTASIRYLDGLGRIVIPNDIRRKLMISNGDQVEIYAHHGAVLIKKHKPMKPIEGYVARLEVAIQQEGCCKNRAALLGKLEELKGMLEPESEAP